MALAKRNEGAKKLNSRWVCMNLTTALSYVSTLFVKARGSPTYISQTVQIHNQRAADGNQVLGRTKG